MDPRAPGFVSTKERMLPYCPYIKKKHNVDLSLVGSDSPLFWWLLVPERLEHPGNMCSELCTHMTCYAFLCGCITILVRRIMHIVEYTGLLIHFSKSYPD